MARAFSGRGRHILTTVTIQIRRDDRERAEGRRQGRPRPKAAVLPGDKDGHVIGIRSDQVRKAVTRHIGETHAPVRITADVDRCCPRERAISATPEQPDGLARPVVDQKVRVAIGVDVVQSNAVGVRRDVDAESRVVPAFEGPSGDPEEQRDMVGLVVCDREVGKPVLVEIRDGQVHRILAGGTGPRHLEAAVTLPGQHENALAAGNHEVKPPVAIQIASLDRGGRASDNGVDAVERELCGGVGGWSCKGEGAGREERETEGSGEDDRPNQERAGQWFR